MEMITIKVDKSNKLNGEYSLYVSFPYDNKIVSVIRQMPSRFWNADDKVWELPLTKLGEFTNALSDYDFDISGLSVISKPKAEIPKGFEFKTKPFEHQIDGFNYGLQNDRWLLGDEQGLGKTKQVIDIAVAKKLQKGFAHTLIICGVNGLKWNWVNEIKIHSDETGYIIGQRQKGKKLVVGSTKDKIADLDNVDAISSHFLITNVESLRDDTIVAKLGKLCANGTIGLIAADEVHKMKNPSSQQGKGFLKLNAECKIAMTGTPLMNTPMDLYIILKWLGFEKHSFTAFKNHHCIMGGYGGYQIIGYKNLDELQENVSSIMLRRLKGDVLDLPEKLFIDEYVDMTPKQAVIYKEVAMDIQNNIDKVATSANPLSALIRMRQATGYTGILSTEIQESAKLDRMEELVEDAVSNGKKVVLFSNWTQMTTPIYDRLTRKYRGCIITGETSDSERMNQVNLFQTDDRYKFIVGTIGAMGTGLTLTAGTVVIFLDEPWTMGNKQQAVDRCHRIGTQENITIYTIMVKNSIDERIHEIVEKKGAMSDALIDGKIAIDKKELIDYLLS